jgi:ATP-binding cassette subfamily F protein 3
MFISHDRHLINAIGTKVIEVRDGRLTHYPGDWEYYLWKKAQETSLASPTPATKPANVPVTPGNVLPTPANVPAKAGSAPAPAGEGRAKADSAVPTAARAGEETATAGSGGGARLGYQERKDLQRRYRKAEKTVFTLEERQRELAALLSDPAHISDYELLYSTSEELRSVKEKLVVANAEWEDLAEAVAALEEQRSPVSGT